MKRIILPLCFFVIIFGFFIIVAPIKVDGNIDNIRYVLSSISQGLFALLALAVTLPVIFTQLMKQNSSNNESQKSNKSTILIDIFYLVIFGISIILPLYILGTSSDNEFNVFLVKISLSCAAFCVYLVIESFRGFKKKWEKTNDK